MYIGSKTEIMHAGVFKIKLRFPENLSLKGKRGMLKSINTRLRNRFNVSVAEIDEHDMWQLATISALPAAKSQKSPMAWATFPFFGSPNTVSLAKASLLAIVKNLSVQYAPNQ